MILPFIFSFSPFAFAQGVKPAAPQPQVVISGPSEAVKDYTVVFNAAASTGLTDKTTYAWFVSGLRQPISKTPEAVFTPERPGEYLIQLVIRTEIEGKVVESQAMQTLTVYARKMVLIADDALPLAKISLYKQRAKNAGLFLEVIRAPNIGTPLGIQQIASQIISDQFEKLTGAMAVVIWTDPVTGMQSLMRAAGSPERLAAVHNQTIIIVADGSLSTIARSVRGPFSILKPGSLLLTRKEAMPFLVASKTIAEFAQKLNERDIEVVTYDASTLALKPWNILSVLVTSMLTHGVASQTVILLLMLPIIATILAFIKQVIGITTFGLYTPSIIALSFLSLGWKIGLVFLLFILMSSYGARSAMRRWRLLYIPKMAIILTVVSFTLLIAISLGARLNIVLAPDTIFVLLIMSTLAESLLQLESEEGWRSAAYGTLETILAALLCVSIVRWPALQSFILAYPESVLLTIVVNIALGRYSGLRLVEYIRFREVMRHLQEE